MAALTVPILEVASLNTATLSYGAGLVAGTIDGTDGAELTPVSKDSKYLLQINVVTGATVTITKGTGLQAAQANWSEALTASRTYYLFLESGRYLHTYGTNKGKILIASNQADTTILAIELP
jgi:hypothetical protein